MRSLRKYLRHLCIHQKFKFQNSKIVLLLVFLSAVLLYSSPSYAVLSIKPDGNSVTTANPLITWDVIGLDSNDVNVGPNRFPVGARICDDAGRTATVNFVWDDGQGIFVGDANANPYINLRAGSLNSITLNFTSTGCQDAYFEV